MHDFDEKGIKVSSTERNSTIPSLRTGRCATPRGLLPAKGSGAPSPRSGRSCRLTLTVLAVALGLALLAPMSASAHFTRPFICRIDSPFSSVSGPTFGPGDVATDASGHLWVSEALPGLGKEETGEVGPGELYEFQPASGSSCPSFVGSLKIEGRDYPERVAVDHATGQFFVTGRIRASGTEDGFVEVFEEVSGKTSKLVDRWSSQFADPSIAINESTPSSVYLAHQRDLGTLQGGDGNGPGVGKFEDDGAPVAFSGSSTGNECVNIEIINLFKVPLGALLRTRSSPMPKVTYMPRTVVIEEARRMWWTSLLLKVYSCVLLRAEVRLALGKVILRTVASVALSAP
jgi:hypothetical protein